MWHRRLKLEPDASRGEDGALTSDEDNARPGDGTGPPSCPDEVLRPKRKTPDPDVADHGW